MRLIIKKKPAMVMQVLAGATGFEPAVSALTGPHVKPLHHAPGRCQYYHEWGGASRIVAQFFPVIQSSPSRCQLKISPGSNQSAISFSADSGESEACVKFRLVINARSCLMVPGSDSTGLVAPMVCRMAATQFSPSQTIAIRGEEQIYLTKPK
jgi:hypothetical protein